MTPNKIVVVNSRVHNLKNVSCEIPKSSFTVVTGPSGSGKSSLVFDTIYKESQRRFIDSLSSYSRYFLGQFQAPDVDLIEGLSPSIAIEQKSSLKNPRSTVGTLTDIYDYLKILFAKTGTVYCPDSGEKIISYTFSQIIKEIEKLGLDQKIIIVAPVPIKNKTQWEQIISKFQSMGLLRGVIENKVFDFNDKDNFTNHNLNTFGVVIDRVIIKSDIHQRLSDSVELALRIGNGIINILINNECLFFSTQNISPATLKVFPKVDTRTFSFNSPHGACLTCKGLGSLEDFDENLLIIDPSFSIEDGAIKAIGNKKSIFYTLLIDFLNDNNLKTTTPLKDYSQQQLYTFFHGNAGDLNLPKQSSFNNLKYPGLITWLRKKRSESLLKKTKNNFNEYLIEKTCHDCHGHKLNKFALSIKINEKNITELCNLSIIELNEFMSKIVVNPHLLPIVQPIIQNITKRCSFLMDVGLDYLNLNRKATTMSGGELQRIRMANQLGSSLSGVLYILDEPSIGLHPKDNDGLLKTFQKLKNNDNTVIVIEHDLETIRNADYIIDLGPGAGINGGEIVATGNLNEIKNNLNSLTGAYLLKSKNISTPSKRRKCENSIFLKGANLYNINNLDVLFPLNSLVCITGVSGSGKTTLLNKILVPAIEGYLFKKRIFINSNFHSIKGLSNIQQIIKMDQGPIGRSPHSNPATFCGFFDEIRNIFSNTLEAKTRGYDATRFSFNNIGGRCEECEGHGFIKVEMHYMADVYLTCEECEGTRYNQETLSVLYKTKNISEVLNMSISEALIFFKNHPKIHRNLETLEKVGLGYIKLGQSATTLSGGEAQRLKIAKELSKKKNGHVLYVLDEPTTGLHVNDISLLLKILNELIEQNNSVFIIEHNIDIIKCADYVIDLGPGGGINGGKIVACGTPEELSKINESYTGQYLKNNF